MTSDIVTFVFSVLMSLVFFVLKLILLPIDLLIQGFLPGISDALTSVGEYLETVATYLGWAISASGIPSGAIILIALYFIFKLTVPIQIWAIKLAIKWYKAIKL